MKLSIFVLFISFFYMGTIAQSNWNVPSIPSSKPVLIDHGQELWFDKDKAKITFDFVSEATTGSIGGLDFDIVLNPDDFPSAMFKGTAQVDELETGNFLRDGHLMWKKFFHKNKYPKIIFDSTKIISEGARSFKVIGDLTIKGITKEITIDFTLFESELIGKTVIYTSDYGVNIHDERERNQLNIKFTFSFVKI